MPSSVIGWPTTTTTSNHYVSSVTKKYTTVSKKSTNVVFRMPSELKNPATKKVISAFADELKAQGRLTPTTLPYLYQLAYLYELNANLMVQILDKGVTQVNLKGETVKHPNVTVQKDFWNQYLAIAKELGLTIKSKVQISGKKDAKPTKAAPPVAKYLPKK